MEYHINNEYKILVGNNKRIESCKKIGGNKKILGHQIEKIFKEKYNSSKLEEKIEYGSTSDAYINSEHPILYRLKNEINYNSKTTNVSIKSGNYIQFHLGVINELNNNNNLEWINNKFNCKNLFNIYLKKINSIKPADLLVYYNVNKWIFF